MFLMITCINLFQLNQFIYLLIAGIRVTAFCAPFVLEEKFKENFLLGQDKLNHFLALPSSLNRDSNVRRCFSEANCMRHSRVCSS